MVAMRFALVLCVVAGLHSSAHSQAGKKHILFNGKNLEGWKAEGATTYPNPKNKSERLPNWTARDGKIHCAGKGYGFLRFEKQQFGDFHFHVEYRMVYPKKRNNSGIGIRTVAYDPKRSRQTRPSIACYEIQLLDDAGKTPTKGSTGSLYRYVAPKVNAVKPAPAWNVMDVTCRGPRIQVRLNDKELIDFDQSGHQRLKKNPLRGYVCLQSHGSVIEFRNVWVQELNANKDSSE